MVEIGRLLTAMVTPVGGDGSIAFDRARELARTLIDHGNDGLVVGGTTGEAPSMSEEERLRLFAEVKEAVGPDVPVIAGTTDNHHGRSLELTREAQRLGVVSVLLTVPAYSRPQQDGVPDGFRVGSGNDDDTFSGMCVGGHGVVRVAGHLVASRIREMIQLVVQRHVAGAAAEHRRLLPLFKALFWVTSPVPAKYALNRAGFDAGPTRLPLAPPDPDFTARFDPVMDAALRHP